MAQKLWEKSVQVNKDIERFTVGRDREMDLYLAKHDVLGSMAHITMLQSIGLLEKTELEQLLAELKQIYALAERGEFVIEDGVEDVHSQVELMLTRKLGDVGKKIHSGRSSSPASRSRTSPWPSSSSSACSSARVIATRMSSCPAIPTCR